MSDSEIIVEESLTEDPAQAFASEMGLDLFDFCVRQLEIGLSESDECQPDFGDDVDEDDFQVSSLLGTN
jgi:hypothetical protein